MLPQTLVTIELHSQRNKEMEKASSSERPCICPLNCIPYLNEQCIATDVLFTPGKGITCICFRN